MSKVVLFARKHSEVFIWLCVVGAVIFIGPTLYANMGYKNQRYNLDGPRAIPPKYVAIVLGAGVRPDGSPTAYLRQRLETAATLYKNGQVKKILASGDNSSKHYDEPSAMRRYLLDLQIPENGIVIDYAGFNTYDSCYRAKHIFGVSSATIITQGYHLPRAILTCQGLGIQTIGVAATKTGRDNTITYLMREYASTTKAVLQITFKPHPTALGSPEFIEY